MHNAKNPQCRIVKSFSRLDAPWAGFGYSFRLGEHPGQQCALELDIVEKKFQDLFLG